jgi:hypothetical protein
MFSLIRSHLRNAVCPCLDVPGGTLARSGGWATTHYPPAEAANQLGVADRPRLVTGVSGFVECCGHPQRRAARYRGQLPFRRARTHPRSSIASAPLLPTAFTAWGGRCDQGLQSGGCLHESSMARSGNFLLVHAVSSPTPAQPQIERVGRIPPADGTMSADAHPRRASPAMR